MYEGPQNLQKSIITKMSKVLRFGGPRRPRISKISKVPKILKFREKALELQEF